ncbi:hypothetical protein F5Y16DRAFT_379880 [Xylariaceae sp. FL0255]|nr:hypothetical protein F5Y16DRAFT_379880 [Xylariaceae sp. FL0255]
MQFTKLAVVAFTVLASLAKPSPLANNNSTNTSLGDSLALPPNISDPFVYFGGSEQAWAQFCNDDACSENCGIWVAIHNTHCLREVNRHSVRLNMVMKPAKWFGIDKHHAVISPDDHCGCQEQCIEYKPAAHPTIPGTDHFCWNITEYSHARSWRFIQESLLGCPKQGFGC